jgi:hypothetical protein
MDGGRGASGDMIRSEVRRIIAMVLLITAALTMSGCSKSQKNAESEEDLASESVKESDAFVEGNIYFIAFHEFGHALVSEFDLPIAGREEDAVDRLAIWMMTPQAEEENPDYLLDAIDGWFSLAEQTPLDDIAWWDEHGTDQQRGYQIACLLYGSNPARYKSLASATEIPVVRQETCAQETAQNDDVWDRLLKPHIRNESAAREIEATVINYGATNKYAKELQYLKQIEVLESLNDVMMQDFHFKPGIKLSAEECGEPNAYWDPDERKLTICYEIVSDYRKMV